MQKRVSPTLIGLFVLSALALAIVAVFILGGDGWSDKSSRFILYFEGDVKGLQVGAPVTLRGVKVGHVEEMSISYQEQKQSFEIPVIITIDQGKLGFEHKKEGAPGRLLLDSMIQRGLRGRLNLQNLVTGKMEVELVFYPDTPVRLTSRSTLYPEIPTIPSNIEKLTSALEELPLERMIKRLTEILDAIEKGLSTADITGIASNLTKTMQGLEKVTANLQQTVPEITGETLTLMTDTHQMIAEFRRELKPMITEWHQVATDTRGLMRDLDGNLNQALGDMGQTLASSDAVLQQIGTAAASVDALIQDDSRLMDDLRYALRELAAAARSVRLVSEYLERHPEALLRGKQ